MAFPPQPIHQGTIIGAELLCLITGLAEIILFRAAIDYCQNNPEKKKHRPTPQLIAALLASQALHMNKPVGLGPFFADGLDTVLVVEEKRSFLEMQLREILYDLPARPAVIGKSHFAATGELDPDKMAKVLCEVLHLAPRPVAAANSLPGRFTSSRKKLVWEPGR